MTRDEKIEIIADILETELEEITEECILKDFESWDSVAVLGVISAVSSETGRFLHADEILRLNTIGDLFALFDAE